MEILKEAVAGTLLSNDCYVVVSPSDILDIELESTVKDQFGDEILQVTEEQLKAMNIQTGKIRIDDKGALNYTIQARVETAVKRSHG